MLKNEHLKYLQDTIDGIPVTTQAKKRKVSGSSQSSSIKTAMKELLQYKAVKDNKHNYTVIVNDKKAQHLNKHRAYWQQAIDDYLNKLPGQNTVKSEPTFQRILFEPISTIFSTDTPDRAFVITKTQRDALSAYDGALLMYNTIVKHYNLTPKS